MIAAARPDGPDPRPDPISQAYRRLRRAGFAEAEAANLLAFANGMAIGPQPWNVREIAHLLFLRELDRTEGRWSHADDRADDAEGQLVLVPAARPRVAARVTPDGAPAVRSDRRGDADPGDGRVTLLTLFRAMAGPDATLDQLRRPHRRPPDGLGGSIREGG